MENFALFAAKKMPPEAYAFFAGMGGLCLAILSLFLSFLTNSAKTRAISLVLFMLSLTTISIAIGGVGEVVPSVVFCLFLLWPLSQAIEEAKKGK